MFTFSGYEGLAYTLYIHTYICTHVPGAHKDQRVCQIPWNWSCRGL